MRTHPLARLSLSSATLIAALAVGLPSAARANADFGVWTEAGVNVGLSKHWRLGFDQSVRLKDDAQHFKSVTPSLHLTWKPKKWISVRFGYRYELEFIESDEPTYIDTWHKAYTEVSFRTKLSRDLRADLRSGAEIDVGWPYKDNSTISYKYELRDRARLEWMLAPRLTVHGAGEIFARLEDPEHGFWHKWRAAGGLERDFGDFQFEIYYAHEERIAFTKHPERHPAENVVGIGFHYDL